MSKSRYMIALSACMICFSGCLLALGAGAGAGGVVYYKGNLTDTLYYSALDVHEAAMKAVGEEGLPILSEKHDPYKGSVRSEYPDGKNVWISIVAVERETTEVKIRVGASGDQKRANSLLLKLKSHLR
ncbi:MAG: DUF3568 family protein [Candidatus Hydrogenedentota bacterium]